MQHFHDILVHYIDQDSLIMAFDSGTHNYKYIMKYTSKISFPAVDDAVDDAGKE